MSSRLQQQITLFDSWWLSVAQESCHRLFPAYPNTLAGCARLGAKYPYFRVFFIVPSLVTIAKMPFSTNQMRAIEVSERTMSVFSLIGSLFIISTFIAFPFFRKPINRLVFYASIGNILCNTATLISTSGLDAGESSSLCKFQGVLIQWWVEHYNNFLAFVESWFGWTRILIKFRKIRLNIAPGSFPQIPCGPSAWRWMSTWHFSRTILHQTSTVSRNGT